MTLSRNQYWIIIGLSIVGLLINNWSIGLWDQDEAAYAGFALRMISSGDYLIPEFYGDWSLIHRKPPLHFWNNVLFFKVFGYNEFAARFSSVLSVCGTSAIVFYFGRKLYNLEIARISSAIAISSLLAFGLAKIAVTDADLLFFQTLALLSLFAYFQLNKRAYLLSLFIGTAGALLVKGPPVYVAGFGFIGLTFLFTKHRWKAIIAFLVMLLAFGPLFLWGNSTWQKDGGSFVTWLIDWYILKRNKPFATQTGPPGYFFLIFLIGLFGWGGYYITGFGSTMKAIWKKEFWGSKKLLLVFWIIPGWILYEFMPSKLPSYAIAAYAPVCFFTGQQLIANKSIAFETHRWVGAFFSLILGVGSFVISFLFLSKIAFGAGIALGLLHLYFLVQYLLKPRTYNTFKGSLQIVLTVIIAFGFIVPHFESQRSAGKIVAQELKKMGTESVSISENAQIPSLLFYIEKQDIEITMNYNKEENGILNDLNKPNHAVIFINPTTEHKLDISQKNILYKVIEGWQMDRGKKIDYYLLHKE